MLRANHYFTGVILCLIAVISWGAMFPVMTHALLKLDPFTFTTLRFTLTGVMLLIFLYCKEGAAAFRLDGNSFLLWLFGSMGFAGFGFFVFLGQKLAGPEGALIASIMMATMPLLGLLVNWVLHGARPPLYSLAFVALSFLGVLLVITKGDVAVMRNLPSYYLADLLMIIGAFCWVVYSISATYFPHWSPMRYSALSTLLGLSTIYTITICLMLAGKIPVPSMDSVISAAPELAYMVVIAGMMGLLCWNYGNKIITPVNGILFMAVVPVAAFIVAAFEGLVPTPVQMLGVVITATALIFNNVYQRRVLASKDL